MRFSKNFSRSVFLFFENRSIYIFASLAGKNKGAQKRFPLITHNVHPGKCYLLDNYFNELLEFAHAAPKTPICIFDQIFIEQISIVHYAGFFYGLNAH